MKEWLSLQVDTMVQLFMHVLSGERFVDDALTTTELDLLCGAYECVSGKKTWIFKSRSMGPVADDTPDDGKRSLKSWWPLARYYEKEECGENYGRWTPRRERWDEKLLGVIEGGDISTQQPLTYAEWKSTQRGPGFIRNLCSHIERSSSQLLASPHPAAAASPPTS